MKAFTSSLANTLSIETLLATFFFCSAFFLLLLLALVISDNYKVAMWLIIIPSSFSLILGFQEFCKDLISYNGNLSPEKVILSIKHFKPQGGNHFFILQSFLMLAFYKLLVVSFGTFISHEVIGLVFVFFVPASYAYSCLTEEILPSLNPIVLLGFARKLGFNYLLIWLTIGLAYLATSLLFKNRLDPSFLLTALATFSLVFCANIIGSSIAVNHRILGIVNPEEEQVEKTLRQHRRGFETQVFQYASARKFEDAIAFIKKSMQEDEQITDEYVRRYLQENNHKQLILRHNDLYLRKLSASGYLSKAWLLLLENLNYSDKYYLEDLHLLKLFVEHASGQEQYKASIRLINRLIQSPEHDSRFTKALQSKNTEIATQKLGNPQLVNTLN